MALICSATSPAVDHFGSAKPADVIRVVGPRDGDDARAGQRGQLRRVAPHATTGPDDDDRLAVATYGLGPAKLEAPRANSR